ncbi:hypothetical protein OS965_41135, partial [Streptomyces sp. H27-G5]|uniref:hypothetical protein n=1 Tax=Streptomyces sp. H27-G5 TaxID=2996698 RepID=UPI00226F3FCE
MWPSSPWKRRWLSPMTPFSVHYGFDRRWAIPALTGEAANALLRDIAPLAQRMLDDWETDLDDRQANVIAVLGDAPRRNGRLRTLSASGTPRTCRQRWRPIHGVSVRTTVS